MRMNRPPTYTTTHPPIHQMAGSQPVSKQVSRVSVGRQTQLTPRAVPCSASLCTLMYAPTVSVTATAPTSTTGDPTKAPMPLDTAATLPCHTTTTTRQAGRQTGAAGRGMRAQ